VTAQLLVLLFGTTDCVSARQPPLPRPFALRHACRTAARAPTCRRRHRSPRRVRPLRAARLNARLVRITLPFTQAAVTVAVAFVFSPLYVRQAIAAFEAVDPNLIAASRTLGAGPAAPSSAFVLPLARGGLAAGEALAFAARLGEFGATIMFAGSLQKVTQTLPLAIYAQFEVNFNVTLGDQRSARPDQRRAADLLQAGIPMAASEQTSRSRFGLLSSS